jgi:hypothetical protein
MAWSAPAKSKINIRKSSIVNPIGHRVKRNVSDAQLMHLFLSRFARRSAARAPYQTFHTTFPPAPSLSPTFRDHP